ncbi:MAG: sensor histidine kinase [Chitinophagaceae bacterium]
MRNRLPLYWICQIGGWSAYCIVYSIIYITIRQRPINNFFVALISDAIIGLILTHLMRTLMKSFDLWKQPLSVQIRNLFITTILFALLYAIVTVKFDDLIQYDYERLKSYTFFDKVLYTSIGTFLFVFIWNLLYFTYHYISKSRDETLDKIRLQSLVKELELKTIKSHINPHFIFNALNSIRALVDENPARARTAITELSNILRSSMQVEKLETTSLEKELDIVKDYLALEYIRFEDRLKIEYDIDEDTLDQPVPPMMLQTLVENAIKHGISKQINGGLIRIISDFKDDHHEIIVQNTGQLNGSRNADGFGIASTNNRLHLLFGEKAAFEIKDVNEEIVQAKVTMPVYNFKISK